MTVRGFVTLLMILTAVPIVGFVVNYFAKSRWYRNQVGWNYLVFMAIIGEFLVLSLWYRITGHHAPEWLAVTCWGQIMMAAWWRWGLLIKSQREQRRQLKEAKAKARAQHIK